MMIAVQSKFLMVFQSHGKLSASLPGLDGAHDYDIMIDHFNLTWIVF